MQEFERRKALERERKKNKVAAHRKICARTIAKNYMASVNSCAFTYLKDVGYFVETFKVSVLEQDVLPWLYTKVDAFLEDMDVAGDFPDVLLSVDEEMKKHEATVQAERDRRAAV